VETGGVCGPPWNKVKGELGLRVNGAAIMARAGYGPQRYPSGGLERARQSMPAMPLEFGEHVDRRSVLWD
jgi:hypothetical protein